MHFVLELRSLTLAYFLQAITQICKNICEKYFKNCTNFIYRFVCFFLIGVSATSEDIPNKIEDLRSECSSDFGGKDSVTSPDGDDSVHGKHAQIAMF